LKKILIIDDEKRLCRVLQLILEAGDYKVATAYDGREGMAVWDTFRPDLVFTDLKMPKADGMEVLRFRNSRFPGTPIIILTAFGTIPAAVEAIKLGAFDYITKPVDNDIIIDKTRVALEKGAIETDRNSAGGPLLIGSSPAMEKVRQEMELVAKTGTSVLIVGESGTGKELAARTIHKLSLGGPTPFVRVNCAAIPRDLLESELFGHKKGAFTGATNDRPGAFVQANGGALFLDEIGDLPVELQPKLLHVVEDKTITPVGADIRTRVEVKIISATNRDLAQMVRTGRFRSDLLYRLNIYTLTMPPLRTRPGDIPELIEHFLGVFSRQFGWKKVVIASDAVALLAKYPWPGNVRELKNMLERLVLSCRERQITLQMVADLLVASDSDTDTDTGPAGPAENKSFFDQEKDIITKALEACGWNQSKAAKFLGISRNTLRYRQKKYNITQ